MKHFLLYELQKLLCSINVRNETKNRLFELNITSVQHFLLNVGLELAQEPFNVRSKKGAK